MQVQVRTLCFSYIDEPRPKLTPLKQQLKTSENHPWTLWISRNHLPLTNSFELSQPRCPLLWQTQLPKARLCLRGFGGPVWIGLTPCKTQSFAASQRLLQDLRTSLCIVSILFASFMSLEWYFWLRWLKGSFVTSDTLGCWGVGLDHFLTGVTVSCLTACTISLVHYPIMSCHSRFLCKGLASNLECDPNPLQQVAHSVSVPKEVIGADLFPQIASLAGVICH